MMREHRTLPADTPSIRLFRSDFLERLTHIPWQAVPLFWLPLALLYTVYGLSRWPAGVSLWWFPACFVLGMVAIWSFVEYVVHRFVFHFTPRTRWQEILLFLVHGIHHVQPHDHTRLVMPLSLSIPLGSILYTVITAAFTLAGYGYLSYPTLVGFAVGYVGYDMVHYATHHMPARNRWLKKLKRHHMEHHFVTPDQRYGVSSTHWDHAFGTMP